MQFFSEHLTDSREEELQSFDLLCFTKQVAKRALTVDLDIFVLFLFNKSYSYLSVDFRAPIPPT